MFDLKPISHDGIEGALGRAERYRLLNKPGEAESICRDILQVEPGNLQARISLILASTDQIPDDADAFARALAAIQGLESDYDRAYYGGIAWERRAKALHHKGGHISPHSIYEWMARALGLFEQAEHLRALGNDDAILRWNACVRFLARHKDLKPRTDDVPEPILSE